jgi:hypothetical protein
MQRHQAEQQNELVRYLHDLNGWLARDVNNRQAELQGVESRIAHPRNVVHPPVSGLARFKGWLGSGTSPLQLSACCYIPACRSETLFISYRPSAFVGNVVHPPTRHSPHSLPRSSQPPANIINDNVPPAKTRSGSRSPSRHHWDSSRYRESPTRRSSHRVTPFTTLKR